MGTSNVNSITNMVVKAKGSATWDPASIPSYLAASGVSHVSVDVTCTGAELGDFALASFSLDTTDVDISCSITAANVVTVIASNHTAVAVNLGSGTLRVLVFDAQIG